MPLSKLKQLQNLQAVRKFTDRESARNAFFRAFENYVGDKKSLQVLMYYGIGGIGKTTLLKHLKGELASETEKKKQKLSIIEINLESAQFDTPATCLFAIYNQLGISSPAFEYALARLWSLKGWSLEDIKRQIINQDSLLFDLVETAADVVGVFAPARLLHRLIDQGSQYAKRWWSDSKSTIQEIDVLTEAELEERLPYYLGLAVEQAAVSKGQYFVFLLDSHDAILQKEAFKTTKRVGDEWLKEFIGSSERGLYVIAGREYLKWIDQNPAWEEYIEQHILGALTDGDADYFLSSIPIPESEIRQAIIETAHGVPLYLDLCASTYIIRKQAKEVVNEKDFRLAEKDVIRRFISHIDRNQAEALKACAMLDRFDQELFLAVTQGLNIHFPITQYSEFCSTSYTVQIDSASSTHKIHDTVRAFIIEEADPEIAYRLVTIILKHCEQSYSVDNAARISWVYEQAFSLINNYSLSIKQTEIKPLVEIGLQLVESGYWKRVENSINLILEQASESELPPAIRFLHALCLRKLGALKEARTVYTDLLHQEDDLGSWMPLVRFNAAHCIHLLGGYHEALQHYEGLALIEGKDSVSQEAQQLAIRQIADVKMLQGRFNEALQSFSALSNVEDDPLWQAELNRFLGHVNRFNFNLVVAEKHYQEALELSTDIHAEAMRGKALTNMAETLCWTSPRMAVSIAAEAIEINQQVYAPIEEGKAMTAQAVALAAMKGKADDALRTANQAATLQQQNGYKSGVLFAWQAKGLAEYVQGNHNAALATLNQMKEQSQEIGVYRYLPLFLMQLLESDQFVGYASQFQWLDFSQTAQSVKAITIYFQNLVDG